MTFSLVRGRHAGFLGVLALAVAAAACGSSSSANGEAAKPGATIFSDAQLATEAAPSVHITGDLTSGSEHIVLDITATQPRSGGSISENGATVDVVRAGQNLYLKGSAAALATLSGSKSAGQLLGDRWLQTTTANKDFSDLGQLFDLRQLVQQLKPTGTVRKGRTTTVDGQSAIGLVDSADDGTLYVATSGQPYVLEIVGGAGEKGTLSFAQYGAAHAPAVPAGAVNLDQLEQGG